MSFDDEQLRALFQQAADAAGQPHDDALDVEHIAAAARGELSREETLAVIDRCASDPAVAEAWRLAWALRSDDGIDRSAGTLQPPTTGLPIDEDHQATPADNVIPLFRRPMTWGGMALAAAALLAVGVASLDADEPVYRDGGEATAITTTLDGVAVPVGEELRLSWASGAEAVRWALTVSDESLMTVHSAEVTTRSATVPADVLAGHEGDTLLWRVEGIVADGSRPASLASPTFTVTVTPAP